ncbi:pentatricopeptide repeat-containing protein At3g48250, chloroplastic-like [Magnolia sinica]|uniref:pentatricopeptide repeat-containing protein At3g48250, chloroplastic-like n=1 Tax=Magnolia sinica TaxID=86752 RepID=UPI002659E63B|nr:pentatricopeptide repeat-containing protein At3g48250, chloroplastic-like [Magnolia sinica]
MMKDAVDLYDYMDCLNKPPAQDRMYLLRKIVVGENQIWIYLLGYVGFHRQGNVLTRTIFDGVLKSLTGTGKLGECDKILKAMEDGGFVANSAVYGQVVLGLCKVGKLDEAFEFLEEREAAGHNPDLKAWASLIQECCVAREIDKAASRFRKMVERKGAMDAGGAFEVLVKGFCLKNREVDACQLLIEMVNINQLRPWHVTYKTLAEKLLAQKSLRAHLGAWIWNALESKSQLHWNQCDFESLSVFG